MVFGTISSPTSDPNSPTCVLSKVEIIGRQVNFFITFTIQMTFQNKGSEPTECRYVFPPISKLCVFDVRFIINGQTIPMQLKTLEEARKIYKKHNLNLRLQ